MSMFLTEDEAVKRLELGDNLIKLANKDNPPDLDLPLELADDSNDITSELNNLVLTKLKLSLESMKDDVIKNAKLADLGPLSAHLARISNILGTKAHSKGKGTQLHTYNPKQRDVSDFETAEVQDPDADEE